VQYSETAHQAFVAPRFLPGDGSEPVLELVEARPQHARGAPVLLVHGAFTGAWIWTDQFLPALLSHGRRVAAVSLRAHGRSQGRGLGRSATLADYARDIRRAMAELAEPPIVIAHSLGALLIQRLLGTVRMRAMVLLTPLPPEGLLLIGSTFFVARPHIWLAVANATFGSDAAARKSLESARRLVFSDRLSADEVRRYWSMMVGESPQALIEAHLPHAAIPAYCLGVPTLVVAADEDPLIDRTTTLRTAAYHAAEHMVAADSGHLLPIEPTAAKIVARVLDWIEGRRL
jgi:pimeloyl-ACP methyl ester carboxylesterase